MLGSSPENDEAGVRSVLEQFGDILEARNGLISPKKLPGCTISIWTVKLILEENETPFFFPDHFFYYCQSDQH